jgi:hypothetical protein
MFNVTIKFQVGPTILEGDNEIVEIRRYVPESQLAKVQEAAVTLGAKEVITQREIRNR